MKHKFYKKIKINKYIILSSALFLCGCASLVTSTLAWFGSSMVVEIDTFNFGTTNKEDFKIGLKNNQNEIDYFQDISANTLIEYGQLANIVTYSPVSSMFQNKWYISGKDDLTPEFRRQYYVGSDKKESTIANSGFVQIETYFYSYYDMYLFLSEQTSIKTNRNANEKYAQKHNIDVNLLNKADDSVRASFYSSLNYTIYEPNTSASSKTPFAGRLDIAPFDDYYDYDATTKNEILYGEYTNEEAIIYSEDARATTRPTYFDCFNALSKDIANPLDIEKSINNGLVVANENSKTLLELSDTSNINNAIAYLPGKKPTRVVISIYIEGWDKDTVSSVINSVIDTKLVFKGLYMAK